MNGAATNPDFDVLAAAGAQVKNALDATMKLNGENYVFGGGREGYMSLLNTDMGRELDHMARFLHMAKDYARAQGFKGTFFIEPKPMEPTKHQYDFDSATVLGFLNKYGLQDDFKLNIEVNHATLAQHTFEHELQVAADNNLLGSIDANRGDYQNGWDTDQFPVDVYELTQSMLIILEAGGFQGGGVNFDAKVRRNSTDLEDIFHAISEVWMPLHVRCWQRTKSLPNPNTGKCAKNDMLHSIKEPEKLLRMANLVWKSFTSMHLPTKALNNVVASKNCLRISSTNIFKRFVN